MPLDVDIEVGKAQYRDFGSDKVLEKSCNINSQCKTTPKEVEILYVDSTTSL